MAVTLDELLALMVPGLDLPDPVPPRPAWHADAACRQHPELNWFPTRGDDLRPIRAVCRECPVADRCLEDAMDLGKPGQYGMWGGLSERERQQVRRTRKQTAA